MDATPADSVKSLLDAIATAPEANDLGRLAQMHTWCLTIGAADESEFDQQDAGAIRSLAGALTTLLEKLILSETANPDGALALIPETVALIGNAWQGQAVDAPQMIARIEAAVDGSQSAATTGGTPIEAPPTAAPEPPAPEPVAAAPAPAPPPPPTDTATDDSEGEAYVSEPLIVDMDESDHLQGFVEEGREHMDAIETALLEVERDPQSTDLLNELFRPFHTIKGIAGFLNLRDINRLTHEVETILDLGRKGEMSITPPIVDLIFSTIDVLKDQIGRLQGFLANPVDESVPQPNITAIMARLKKAARGGAASGSTAPVAAPVESITPSPEIERDDRNGAAKTGPGSATGADQSIRVDTRKLDFLVDAVGELVIAQTMVNLHGAVAEDEKLSRNVLQVTKIVRDVQECAMAMRMVPIGQTFQKMRRVVRDVARKAGKTVELRISGEDTELDKNVIQAISDPLVHMVRNAIDHGVETPSERATKGKPPGGDVHLNAYHQGDSIVIEISDDGRGLDRDKLVAKGVERGMIGPDDKLSDQQVFALVMAAGFSTAQEVTDISGRGVGMDVVRRNIETLRGKIEIESELGRGSVFRIRLPLTLAIIDGMLVRVGSERMIIPTIMIEQSLRPESKQISSVQQRGELIKVRGELITVVQLGELFGFSGRVAPDEALVVIVQCGTHKLALVVDELIGQQQVVIKTLGEKFKNARGVSGAAILGDGRVGLILEPAGLLELHNSQRCATRSKTAPEPETPPEEPPLNEDPESEQLEPVTADAPEADAALI